ncbi:hypothetical protein HJFPF1_08087 [Paramyrothecium foliicola]|nr:hypothetical protein HJFPF1_08087 [Paramyrothecium foliicola]
MLLSQVFLSLVAGVSAIDVWLQWEGDCSGSALFFRGIAPNTCYWGESVNEANPFGAIHFLHIPGEWDLELRGHAGPRCGPIEEIQRSGGRNSVCLKARDYQGAGYGFLRKRSESTEKDCVDGGRPSGVALSDGTQYDLTQLDDAAFKEMPSFSFLLLRRNQYILDPILPFPFPAFAIKFHLLILLFLTFSIAIAAAQGNATDVPATFDAFKLEVPVSKF